MKIHLVSLNIHENDIDSVKYSEFMRANNHNRKMI